MLEIVTVQPQCFAIDGLVWVVLLQFRLQLETQKTRRIGWLKMVEGLHGWPILPHEEEHRKRLEKQQSMVAKTVMVQVHRNVSATPRPERNKFSPTVHLRSWSPPKELMPFPQSRNSRCKAA